jgi:hypothetical protein
MIGPPVVDAGSLSGPIPGMSLTTEPGNRPWENPPHIVSLEDAITFYSERILDPEKQDAILNAFDQKVSIESMADMLTTSAVMDGIHTLDISVLINPVIQEMLKYVGDINDIEYVESYEELEKKKRIPQHEARRIVEEVAKEMDKEKIPSILGKTSTLEEESMEIPKKGLMARKQGVEE